MNIRIILSLKLSVETSLSLCLDGRTRRHAQHVEPRIFSLNYFYSYILLSSLRTELGADMVSHQG